MMLLFFFVWAEAHPQGASLEKSFKHGSPPNPSVNHNVARDTHHDGTATWFTQGSTFEEWKKNGSLLWIRGNRALRSLS